MNDFAAKEIRNIYSSYDGWRSTSRTVGGGYDKIVTLERSNGGHRERVNVLVTFEKAVPAGLLDELKEMPPVTDGYPSRDGYAVVMPGNADASAVPAGIPTYTMSSFAFEGKNLIWVKKPVRKEEPAKKAA